MHQNKGNISSVLLNEELKITRSNKLNSNSFLCKHPEHYSVNFSNENCGRLAWCQRNWWKVRLCFHHLSLFALCHCNFAKVIKSAFRKASHPSPWESSEKGGAGYVQINTVPLSIIHASGPDKQVFEFIFFWIRLWCCCTVCANAWWALSWLNVWSLLYCQPIICMHIHSIFKLLYQDDFLKKKISKNVKKIEVALLPSGHLEIRSLLTVLLFWTEHLPL